MKREGQLFERIIETDNLLDAFHKAKRGKAGRGDVRAFQKHLNERTSLLRAQLVENRFVFGPYHEFMVHDPKPRLIQSAPFEQRVLHHAIINVAGPILERSLIFDTYACRKGKGQHAAIRRAFSFARRSRWFLKMDVKKFYDSVRHETLQQLVARRFKDQHLLQLFADVLGSYAVKPDRGLPIGNLTSQYLGNYYLDGLDHYIKEDLKRKLYVRYMDDMLIFGNHREDLLSVRNAVQNWLWQERGLVLNDAGQINRLETGAPFLGVVLRPHRITLVKASARRYSRKMKTLKRHFQRERVGEYELQERSTALFAAVTPWATDGFINAVEQRQKSVLGYA